MSHLASPAFAEAAAESQPEGNDTGRSLQSLQLRESCNCKEPRGWISEADWTIYIRENSDDDRRSPSVVSIFRVPNFLKRLKREAYVPKMVSLGPYHHTSAEVPLMGNHKGRALHLMRTRFNNINRNLANDPNDMDFSDRAREEIMKLEKEIRDSYEEKIDCDGNTLALMLTLDGCFILEILRTLGGDKLPGDSTYYEPLFQANKIAYIGEDILHDIVMLENQIPLIVIQKLLTLEFNSVDDIKNMLLKMSFHLWHIFCPSDDKDMKQWFWPQEQVPHLLGLLHSVIVSPFSDRAEPTVDPIKCSSAWSNFVKWRSECCSKGMTVNNVRRIHRAIELRKAGIKFKRCDGGIGMIKFDRKNATIFLYQQFTDFSLSV